jgi:hypothetical protein
MLKPRVAVPIHRGTFATARASWRSDPAMPAREFERHAALHAPDADRLTDAILAPRSGALVVVARS